MIETTIPEINVSELMERVRLKVEQIGRTQVRPRLPLLTMVHEIAATVLPKPVTPKTEKILRATQVAREATTVRRWIPKPLRGLFRRQGQFNREVLRAIESLSDTNAKFADRLRHLIACIEIQDQGIHHLANVRRADGPWMDEMARSRENDTAWVQSTGRVLSGLTRDHRKMLRTTNALAQQLAAVEEKSIVTEQAIKSVESEVRKLGEQIASFDQGQDALAKLVRELRDDFARVDEHSRSLQAQADALTSTATDLQAELAKRAEHDKHVGEQLGAESAQRAAVRQDVESLEQRHTSDSAFIKAELSRQSELVHRLLDRTFVRPATKSSPSGNGELSEAAAHRLDAFYFSFENRFRGPREEIKRRLRFYLPLIENCQAGKQGRPIVDLGCGRGEWLELVREQKLAGTGVDLNEAMIAQCNQRKLDVVQADAVEFLRRQPDDSHGAITGFHIIEHLPLNTLVDLISETFRVLKPGGLAIFESPNCKNLTVGACYFYIDPTHRNPVFPETAQFMLETAGFERVTLEYLAPVETSDISNVDEHPAHLRELLYGPRDFGVIGFKPDGQQLKRVPKTQ